MFVTATETVIGLFDTECTSDKCQMPKKYARANSKNFANGLHSKNEQNRVIYQEPWALTAAKMRKVNLNGFFNADKFGLRFHKYSRETTVSAPFYRITDYTQVGTAPLVTGYSGFLGLGPIKSDPSALGTETNFLNQMKMLGHINALTVAFYVNLDCP